MSLPLKIVLGTLAFWGGVALVVWLLARQMVRACEAVWEDES
jgi:hypothetical protein